MNRYTLTKTDEIKRGAHAAFIDSDYNASFSYRPEFLSNDYRQGKKVLSSIEAELSNCDEFCISVAFITMSGITPLLQVLRELEEKGVPGKILTTDYLTFSEPKALEKLSQLKNIELKMFCTDNETGGFHTKGYIFRKEEIYRIIIGSSNLTMNAMTKNREWNTKIVSTAEGAMAKEVVGEFDSFWNDKRSLRYEQFIETYKTKYKIVAQQKAIAAKQKVIDYRQLSLKPNKMQVAFVANLKKIVEQGEKRALLRANLWDFTSSDVGPFFRGSFWNYTSKHIGGIAMAGRKEYRDLTVGNIYRNGKSIPMLRVSGLWLEELGFKTGDFVRIKCKDGQLIISLNVEKAQEKAEEKAFMEEEKKKLQKKFQKEKEEIHARFVAEGKVGYGA